MDILLVLFFDFKFLNEKNSGKKRLIVYLGEFNSDQIPHLEGYLSMKIYFPGPPFCVSYFYVSLVEKEMLLPET